MAFWGWRPRKQESGPNRAPEKERRSSVRLPGSRVTSCVVIRLPENTPLAVALRDISTNGVGLVSRKPVERGKFLAVDLKGAHDFSRLFRVQVVHCTLQQDSSWLLGCIPIQELTPEELEPFV